MARTPLMRSLLTLARCAALSMPARPSPDAPRITRRALLAGAGATTGLNLLGAERPSRALVQATPTPDAPRIGIVGAGIAGLTAALTLHDAGLSATVFEAADRVGGRMHSNRMTWAEGQTSEWCGELIDTEHTIMQALASRFSLPLIDLLAAMPADSEDTNFFFGRYYREVDVARDLPPVFRIAREQLEHVGPETRYDTYTPDGYLFDQMSVAQWIEAYVPGGYASPLGQLIDITYATENGRDTAEQSALGLIYQLGDQPDADTLSLLGTSDERFHIEGGNQRLPEAIADHVTSMAPRCDLRTGWRMTAVAQDLDGVTLSFATSEGLRQEQFAAVILAIPFSVLRTLDYVQAGFDPLKRRAITELSYATNAKLQLQFDRRFWRERGMWPGVSNGFLSTDLGFQNGWEVTRGQPGEAGIINLYTGSHIGAGFLPDGPYTTSLESERTEGYARQFLALLEDVWPGASRHYTGTATLSAPATDLNLLGSYPAYTIGQLTSFGGYEAIPQGNVHFAGDHTILGLTGFMEGAARSGERAAREILDGRA
jgi:monoamine oxidase